MKGTATRSEPLAASTRPNGESESHSHKGTFAPVLDSRNRRVPGLCIRNGRYYAQLWIERIDGRKAARRFPLTVDGRPVTGITEAKSAMDILRHQRREDKLPTQGRKPTFSEFADAYLENGETLQKKERTVKCHRLSLDRWKAHIGAVRIDKITPAHAAAFKNKRLKGQGTRIKRARTAGPRTVNTDLMVLRKVLAAAKEAGHLRETPAIPLMDEPPPKRRTLISTVDFNALLAACQTADLKNGEQLADYLRFLAYSGAREQEALCVAWDDVDIESGIMAIGSGGTAKNRETRTIDLNPDLLDLLKEMETRRQPDSRWLFPSPQRGKHDRRTKTFRETFKRVRDAAKLPHVGFHHLRVMFISRAVMAGVDYLTIASWVGHKDGGVLIGRVYGRLRDEHRKKMAAKLTFTHEEVQA